MKNPRQTVVSATGFPHHQFLWLLLAAYAVSAALPSLGQWTRNVTFGELAFHGDRITLSLPSSIRGNRFRGRN